MKLNQLKLEGGSMTDLSLNLKQRNKMELDEGDQICSSDLLSFFFDEALEDGSNEDSDQIITRELNSDKSRYEILKEVNKGAMKKIYLAKDHHTGRQVAMAMRLSERDSGEVEGFLREARINAALQHPNIMPVHDLGLNEYGNPTSR